jgi:hypothetical protein
VHSSHGATGQVASSAPELRCNFAGVSCLRASRQVVVAVEYEQIAAAPLALHRVPRRQLVALSAGVAHRRRVCRLARPVAPGHASKVRVDRLQGRRPLVMQRAQPMKLPMSSRT